MDTSTTAPSPSPLRSPCTRPARTDWVAIIAVTLSTRCPGPAGEARRSGRRGPSALGRCRRRPGSRPAARQGHQPDSRIQTRRGCRAARAGAVNPAGRPRPAASWWMNTSAAAAALGSRSPASVLRSSVKRGAPQTGPRPGGQGGGGQKGPTGRLPADQRGGERGGEGGGRQGGATARPAAAATTTPTPGERPPPPPGWAARVAKQGRPPAHPGRRGGGAGRGTGGGRNHLAQGRPQDGGAAVQALREGRGSGLRREARHRRPLHRGALRPRRSRSSSSIPWCGRPSRAPRTWPSRASRSTTS